jgi:hypothetical protein
MRYIFRTGLGLGIGLLCLTSAAARADITLVRPYDTAPAFKTDDGPVAEDLSGIACMPPQNGSRRCVAVNDQDRFAQFVSVQSGLLVPGETIPLLVTHDPGAPFGVTPTVTDVHCSRGDGGFKDLDGEAVVFARPYFYVVGSHGCSRNKKKFHASSFITARFRVNEQGKLVRPDGGPLNAGENPVQLTYRLTDALRFVTELNSFFGADLQGDGANIEGVLVINKTLYAGLRAPAVDDQVFLIRADAEPLFAPGKTKLLEASPPVRVRLGPRQGIRDLTTIPDDDRLLILAGPTTGEKKDETVPYSVFVVPPTGGDARKLGDLPSFSVGSNDARAEAIQVLDRTGDKLRLLVLHDHVPNGAPREYEVDFK